MDTLAHAFLGATVGHLVGGDRLGRPAILLGVSAANAPDLDVFFHFSDPVLTHQLHRHCTHALIMIPVLAALATAPFLVSRRLRVQAYWLFITALLACATHTLLDACTSYGTLLFWPFVSTRISWDFVAVIDPLITLPLLIATVLAFRGRGARVSVWALACVVCYTGLAAWQHHRAEVTQQAIAASRGHTPTATRVRGKRTAPPEVAPVVNGDMQYRASTSRPGCVEASGRETWWRQIYLIAYEPGMEKDVQDVFIKEMKLVDGSLQIVNERGDEYKLDLRSLNVEAVKGSIILRKGR
ncbi:MAG: metal-dependent hydrolase [Tepidisphaeraceae bacterium]|jgi:inner membrane protein